MLKHFKPVTPSQRHTVLLNNKHLNSKNTVSKLIKNLKRKQGRNNQGRITVRHRGGGHKRLYRKISFKRGSIKGFIRGLEYDPNRSANIALVEDQGNFFYILAPEKLKVNDWVESGTGSTIKVGNSLPLNEIPLGSLIHNISLKPYSGGQLVRSAGTFAQLLQKNHGKYAKIRLVSGEQRLVPLNCEATLGIVSNSDHKNIKIGKAGRNRWLNKRPKVRGVAKNPVDHPHGGGEGKTSGGRPSVSFTGRITKGQPTRKRKSKYIIKKRNK